MSPAPPRNRGGSNVRVETTENAADGPRIRGTIRWGEDRFLSYPSPGKRREYLGRVCFPDAEYSSGGEGLGAEPLHSPLHGREGVDFPYGQVDDSRAALAASGGYEVPVRGQGDGVSRVRVGDEFGVGGVRQVGLPSRPRLVS